MRENLKEKIINLWELLDREERKELLEELTDEFHNTCDCGNSKNDYDEVCNECR